MSIGRAGLPSAACGCDLPAESSSASFPIAAARCSGPARPVLLFRLVAVLRQFRGAAHRVFALDLPGFGLSEKGNRLYSPDNFSKVIETAES